MKKILLFLSFLLMSIGMWSADEVAYTLTPASGSNNSYAGNCDITIDGIIWNLNGNSQMLPWRLGGKSISSVNRTLYSKTTISDNITKIVITHGSASSITVNSMTIIVSKNSNFTSPISTLTPTFKANNTVTIDRPSGVNWNGCYYKIIYNLTVSGNNNKFIEFSEAKFYKSSETKKYTVKFLNCDTLYEQRAEIKEDSTISTFHLIEPSEDCKKNGWAFIGWTKNGIDTLQSLKVEKNDTLYALYKISDIGTGYVTDTLTIDKIGISGQNYTDFPHAVNCTSSAIYDGYIAGGDNQSGPSIQMRVSGSNSGIITKESGGLIDSIWVEWNSHTTAGHALDIYTNDSQYDSPSDIYNLPSYNTYSSIIYGASNGASLNHKKYVGLRSHNGAIFLNKIFIRWTLGEVPVYSLCPKCYDAGVTVAHWYADAVKFDIDDIGDSAQVILLSTKDTICQKVRQDDWSYKFDKVGLNNLKCTSLKLTTFKSNDTTCIRRYQIPIMISGTTNTLCDSCDVVVLSEGQLNIDKDTVSGDVTIYEGGRLKVNAGKNYSINSLTLRRENNSVPHLLNNGNITLASDSNYFFEIRTDAADWRWSTLPSSHKVSDIKQHNGKPIALNSEVYIKHYDGNARAVNHKNGWDYVKADSVLTSGQGFLFGVDLEGNRMKIYRFTFPNDSVNKEKTSKTITGLRAWGCNDQNLAPNHKGWNLIGNPFADNDTTDIIDPIKTGELVKDTTVTPWNGKWVYREGSEASLRYAVIPITWRKWTADEAAAGGYASELLDDYVLPPFTSFFVQIGGDASAIKTLTFKPVGANPINRIVAHASQYDEDEELFLRVKVGDRKTGMFISNKFTDEYEPGDDLESRYPIYQSIGDYKLLYSAINDSIIEHGVQVTAPQGMLYLDPKVDINKFEYIYALYNDDWYDLKNGLEVEVNGTFIIQAKRKTKESTTSVENINLNLVIKYILDGNLYIKMNNKIYNILGDRIQ